MVSKDRCWVTLNSSPHHRRQAFFILPWIVMATSVSSCLCFYHLPSAATSHKIQNPKDLALVIIIGASARDFVSCACFFGAHLVREYAAGSNFWILGVWLEPGCGMSLYLVVPGHFLSLAILHSRYPLVCWSYRWMNLYVQLKTGFFIELIRQQRLFGCLMSCCH